MTRKKTLSTYINETKEELKKVTWPSKKETINHTIVVIAISLALATFIGVIDYIFTVGLNKLIS